MCAGKHRLTVAHSFTESNLDHEGLTLPWFDAPAGFHRRLQVILVINQQSWTHTLETVIKCMPEDPLALTKHHRKLCEASGRD